MDLTTGKLYWPDTLLKKPVYPPLEEDIECDVVVVGGGEAGALSSYYLSKHVNTVVIDKRSIGGGSSSANTGLLQYANDKSLTSCIHTFGEEQGLRFYQLCKEAVDRLESLCGELEFSPEYTRRSSLYVASTAEDVPALKEEYTLLRKHGFDVEYWEPKQIAAHYSFQKPGAIYSKQDADINPYKLAHALIFTASLRGLRVFQHTEIVSHITAKDHIVLTTKQRRRIKASKVIFATGYETQTIKKNPNAVLESSYAIATDPLTVFPGWFERSMIWETARPYLYMRTTADNRIIVGGLDEPTNQPQERDSVLLNKKRLLLMELQKLFPQLQNIQAPYYWSGTFGSTHDGLPYVGEQANFPHCYFTLGYGGNGTVYSTIAAEILTSLIIKGSHPDAALFRFDRPKKETGVFA